jgi:hypothetical protein
MSYLKDKKANQKLIELLDELCQTERLSGRGSTIILIPHEIDEQIFIAINGKPASASLSVNKAIQLAFNERE